MYRINRKQKTFGQKHRQTQPSQKRREREAGKKRGEETGSQQTRTHKTQSERDGHEYRIDSKATKYCTLQTPCTNVSG